MTQQQDGKEEEREAQRQYWKEHSGEATVEAMMLDSQAADIDKMERPEVSPWATITVGLRSPRPQGPSAPWHVCTGPLTRSVRISAGVEAAGFGGGPAGRGAGCRHRQVGPPAAAAAPALPPAASGRGGACRQACRLRPGLCTSAYFASQHQGATGHPVYAPVRRPACIFTTLHACRLLQVHGATGGCRQERGGSRLHGKPD